MSSTAASNGVSSWYAAGNAWPQTRLSRSASASPCASSSASFSWSCQVRTVAVMRRSSSATSTPTSDSGAVRTSRCSRASTDSDSVTCDSMDWPPKASSARRSMRSRACVL